MSLWLWRRRLNSFSFIFPFYAAHPVLLWEYERSVTIKEVVENYKNASNQKLPGQIQTICKIERTLLIMKVHSQDVIFKVSQVDQMMMVLIGFPQSIQEGQKKLIVQILKQNLVEHFIHFARDHKQIYQAIQPNFNLIQFDYNDKLAQ